MRIYPSAAHLTGDTVSYILNNFPSPQYAFSAQPYPIEIQVYNDLKQVNTEIYTIPGLEISSCNLPVGILTTTSPYIYDTGVTYKF